MENLILSYIYIYIYIHKIISKRNIKFEMSKLAILVQNAISGTQKMSIRG